jgi:hypothetical protein
VWTVSRTATDPTNTVVANQGVCRTGLTSHPQLCGFATRAHRLSAHVMSDHAHSYLTHDTNSQTPSAHPGTLSASHGAFEHIRGRATQP